MMFLLKNVYKKNEANKGKDKKENNDKMEK